MAAASGETALRLVAEHDFAVILLDVRMPGIDGFETARRLRRIERTEHVPIIFLTAGDDQSAQVTRGYEAGAVDFLFKPFDAAVLSAKVQVFLELHAYRRESERQALRDELTGLANRTLFHDHLEMALARAKRGSAGLAVMYLDIDRFKLVNDQLGHDAGDRLLIELARRLRRVVRPSDTIARMGEDEFTVLCEDIGSTRQTLGVADRVAEAIKEPLALPEGEINPAASIGIAVARAEDTAESLLRGADRAMYRAKRRWGLASGPVRPRGERRGSGAHRDRAGVEARGRPRGAASALPTDD